MQDLEALAPPAIMCIAVLAGVYALLKHEMAPSRKRQRAAEAEDEQRSAEL